jgi:hypothetical protein
MGLMAGVGVSLLMVGLWLAYSRVVPRPALTLALGFPGLRTWDTSILRNVPRDSSEWVKERSVRRAERSGVSPKDGGVTPPSPSPHAG